MTTWPLNILFVDYDHNPNARVVQVELNPDATFFTSHPEVGKIIKTYFQWERDWRFLTFYTSNEPIHLSAASVALRLRDGGFTMQQPVSRIRKAIPDCDVQNKGLIHLFVCVDTLSTRMAEKTEKAVSKILQDIQDGPSPPSAANRISEMQKMYSGDGAPYDGRNNASGPPIGFFEPAFAQLQQDLTALNRIEVSNDVRAAVAILCRHGAVIFSNGADRIAAIRGALRVLLCHPFPELRCLWDKTDESTNITPDLRSMLYLGEEPVFKVLINVAQVKNEEGISGSSVTQVEQVYRKFISHPNYAPIRNVSKCPALLIAIAGPWISFFGAIFVDGCVIIEAFTPRLSLGGSPWHRQDVENLSAIFTVIQNTVHALIARYQTFKPFDLPLRGRWAPEPSLQPHDAQLLSDRHGKLKFKKRMISGVSRTVFEGTLGEQDVVIKLSSTYSVNAHELLSSHDPPLAPKLLFSVELVGGGFMIIMERVEAISRDSERLPQEAKSQIQTALDILHEANIVHGDVRRPNILVVHRRRNEDVQEGDIAQAVDPELGAMLIDFEWSGTHGEVTYPYNVNTEVYYGIDGIVPGGRILKSHDIELFEIECC